MSEPFLSLCMIVKNEQENLPRCLASVKDVVDELIIVDTGSTDRTIEIAQNFGARVYHFPWNDDFSAARNHSLEQAKGEWIIYLDADEELEEKSRSILRKCVQEVSAQALTVLVRNLNPPGSLAPYYDSVQVRLFRNSPVHRFERRIHNQILPAIERHGGSASSSSLVILHYGYLSRIVQGGIDRLERSQRLLKKAIEEDPESPYLLAKLGFVYYESGKWDEAYPILKHVIFELDCRTLEPSFVHQILAVLGDVALQRREFDFAVRCSLAGLQLNTQPSLNLFSQRTQALAILGRAEEDLHSMEDKLSDEKVKIPHPRLIRYRKAFDEINRNLKEAESILRNLLDGHGATKEAKEHVSRFLGECQTQQARLDELMKNLLSS